jgi:lysophospholipid acyltransferase (LPLAT)-like uncharacterized protein
VTQVKKVKKLLNYTWVRFLVCRLLARYLRYTYRRTRWEYIGKGTLPNSAAIYIFWHGRALMMPCFWPEPSMMHVLVSPHRDGKISQGILHALGFPTIDGTASNLSRLTALKKILRVLKQGASVAITPDGPRGPRLQLHSQVVNIAKAAAVPIVACTYAVEKGRFLRSWDRALLPYPGGKGCFMFAEPVYVPANASMTEVKQLHQKIEQNLRELYQRCDRQMGGIVSTPDPVLQREGKSIA